MSMNLHLQFLDDDGLQVNGVHLVQTPTDVKWWCIGYKNRDGTAVVNYMEPTVDEIKARYFEWLDEIYTDEGFEYLKENVDKALIKYAKYKAEFYWM